MQNVKTWTANHYVHLNVYEKQTMVSFYNDTLARVLVEKST